MNGDKLCKCQERFTGSNCDQCIEGYYGIDCTKQYGTMKDANGKSYKTVVIGNQTWMAENMNYPYGNYEHVLGDQENDDIKDLLYDWNTALSVCPNGWHLPSKEEFEQLLTYVGANRSSPSDALALLAKSLLWEHFSRTGGDDFGFGFFPANIDLSISGLWSSSSYNDNEFDVYHLKIDFLGDIWIYMIYKSDYQSVRCIKD